jgi:double-stranded uracil-DNA glycosylase
MTRHYSFAPVVRADARVLILGSMPGVASLAAQQYYAHPRNQFWPIIESLYGAPCTLPYAERLSGLQRRGVALWDVLQSCVRAGSLDAAIEQNSAVANDLPQLLRAHSRIARLCCNGATAYGTLIRHFGELLQREFPLLPCIQLPSTSPAHASMRFEHKLERWAQALRNE